MDSSVPGITHVFWNLPRAMSSYEDGGGGRGQLHCVSTFQTPICITSINILLAEITHMAEPQVDGKGSRVSLVFI